VLEWLAIVVNATFFLVAIAAVLALVIAHVALGVPLAGNSWSRFALGALTVASGLEVALRLIVRSRRRAETRRGYTSSPDRSLALTGVHPVTGAVLRPAGTAPAVDGLDGLVRTPVPEQTLAPPMPGSARFEFEPNWVLWFTVIVSLVIAPVVVYFKAAQRPGGLGLEQLGGILIAAAVAAAAVVATVRVVRALTRAARRIAVRRLEPTAVLFSVRRTQTLDEALAFLGIRLRTASIVAVMTFDRLELWQGSKPFGSFLWRDVVEVRPGRVARGRWPVPRWSRAILVRVPASGREIDLALTPFGGLYQANLLLDEFRHRARVVPKRAA
jgi:hypothetical protein